MITLKNMKFCGFTKPKYEIQGIKIVLQRTLYITIG